MVVRGVLVRRANSDCESACPDSIRLLKCRACLIALGCFSNFG